MSFPCYRIRPREQLRKDLQAKPKAEGAGVPGAPKAAAGGSDAEAPEGPDWRAHLQLRQQQWKVRDPDPPPSPFDPMRPHTHTPIVGVSLRKVFGVVFRVLAGLRAGLRFSLWSVMKVRDADTPPPVPLPCRASHERRSLASGSWV